MTDSHSCSPCHKPDETTKVRTGHTSPLPVLLHTAFEVFDNRRTLLGMGGDRERRGD